MLTFLSAAVLLGIPSVSAGTVLADSCMLAPVPSVSAASLLQRARDVIGMSTLEGHVVHFRVNDDQQQNYQSDRSYPPFFSDFVESDIWFDPATGAERVAPAFVGQGFGPQRRPIVLSNGRAAWIVGDTTAQPSRPAFGMVATSRPLDVLATLYDWGAARDVRVLGSCAYRDYPRIVLARRGLLGEERLYLDPKTGFPVKLEREEPQYLWGQRKAEYVWMTWNLQGSIYLPIGVVALKDGAVETSRGLGATSTPPRDSAPNLRIPDTALSMPIELPRFLQPLPPDTVRVDANTFLLVNPGYTEAVALVHDTVYVLDATQSEQRARQDSAWIGRLFPGKHPITLIVTDLAWPHVAGVRYWVAQSVPVVSSRRSRPFLEQIVARRWTRAPDLLEQRRARNASAVRLRLVGVGDSLAHAGISVYPIDGIGSEGAIMAYLPDAKFLWASDYFQDVQNPALYTAEVVRAAGRVGAAPERVAGEHVPLTAWSVATRLAATRLHP